MIATACLITSLINKKQTENKSNINNTEQNQKNEEKSNPDEEIKALSESNRMKRYIGKFFEDIEAEEYMQAYNKLNEDFRKNYFSTLEDFIKYADSNFKTSMLGVTYDNIERWGNNKTGNMYIIWITVADSFKGKKETNFVIIEKDYNNYEMSFSVNLEE